MPGFSLPHGPGVLTVTLRSGVVRSPTDPGPAVRPNEDPAASAACLSPVHFRRGDARPVSYYALFKWWLLLSQHPGCLRISTSFST